MVSLESVSTFQQLLLSFLPCFHEPTGVSFLALAAAWTLAGGPRTIANLTRILLMAGKAKSYDAYQYFFSNAVWQIEALFEILFRLILASGLIPPGVVIELAGDDTLVHHCGRKIFGVGIFRDAVRSSRKHVAYAAGHNWVVLCMIVRVPWAFHVFVTLPVLARLRPKSAKKKGRNRSGEKSEPTTVDLLGSMVAHVASWAPQRRFRLVADGAYASLAGRLPENVGFISRLRKDAALYGPPPVRRSKKAGRPRKKGPRLPTPQTRAKSSRLSWKRTKVVLYGEEVLCLLHSYLAYWYDVYPDGPIRIVIVRDPEGEREDEFFFSPEVTLSPREIVQGYGRRWAQEVTNREAKQAMGIDEPQARTRLAVERQAPFCFLLLSLVKLWYLTVGHRSDSLLQERDAWYPQKEGPAFADMLRALRFAGWRSWILSRFGLTARNQRILRPVLRLLARAQ